VADLNQNIYGSLVRFKNKYAKSYLIRLGSREDIEPQDFNDEIDNRLTEALKAASDQIDSLIVSKHSTPVDPAPDFFERDCYAIAIMILLEDKGYEPDTPDDKAVKTGEKRLKYYEGVAKGSWDFKQPDDQGETTTPTRTKSFAPDKVFSSSRLDGYIKGDPNA